MQEFKEHSGYGIDRGSYIVTIVIGWGNEIWECNHVRRMHRSLVLGLYYVHAQM